MSLETAFKRLAIRPSTLCTQCRRAFATTTRQRQQNATASFTDLLTNNHASQNNSAPRQQQRDALDSISSTPSSTAASPTSTKGWSMAESAIQTATSARREQAQRRMLLDQERGYNRQDLERQLVHRKFRPGDVYAPHDLTGVEMAKWKKLRRKPRPKYDVMDQLGINPKDHYKNFAMMSEYISEMGRIKHSNETGLRPVNQRRMAKAIRRAMGVGVLMPGTHKHPEILRADRRGSGERY